MSSPRYPHSLLKLIASLANSRHLEATQLATALADAGNPDRRPLLTLDGDKFKLIPQPSL